MLASIPRLRRCFLHRRRTLEVAPLKTMPAEAMLLRGIGRWDLVAILINVVVGAGVLGLPAKAFALIGVYSIAAWVLCAVMMGFIAACFAEVGSRFTQTGGPYLHAHAAFGPAAGFIVGWLGWISRLFSFATIANLAVTYAAGFAPAVGGGILRFIVIVFATTLLSTLLVTGIRRTALVNNALTSCKLLLLVGFAVAGMWFVDFSGVPAHPAPAVSDWQAALMLMSFAFLGIESALITSGEVKNPPRDMPFALGTGLAVVAVLYLSIQVVCIGTLPDLATSQRPVVDAAERAFGPTGGWIVNIGALVTMCGTLFAILLTGSRLPFALAERGQLPARLAAIHPRFHTPHVAILITGLLSGLLALYSSFLGALAVSALTRLVGYATTCAALVVLRRREASGSANSSIPPAAYRVPGGPVVALIALAACAFLMLAITFDELKSVAVITLIGAAIGAAYRTFRSPVEGRSS